LGVNVIVFEQIFSVAFPEIAVAGVPAAAGKRFRDLIGGKKLLLLVLLVLLLVLLVSVSVRVEAK